jgi:hypothetical protein
MSSIVMLESEKICAEERQVSKYYHHHHISSIRANHKPLTIRMSIKLTFM